MSDVRRCLVGPPLLPDGANGLAARCAWGAGTAADAVILRNCLQPSFISLFHIAAQVVEALWLMHHTVHDHSFPLPHCSSRGGGSVARVRGCLLA